MLWGAPCPDVRTQIRQPYLELRILTPMGESLWYNYFPVCGSPTSWLWQFIVLCMCHIYHLVVASSLSLEVEYLFCRFVFFFFFCQWLFSIWLWVWCVHESRWDQLLLFHHQPWIQVADLDQFSSHNMSHLKNWTGKLRPWVAIPFLGRYFLTIHSATILASEQLSLCVCRGFVPGTMRIIES